MSLSKEIISWDNTAYNVSLPPKLDLHVKYSWESDYVFKDWFFSFVFSFSLENTIELISLDEHQSTFSYLSNTDSFAYTVGQYKT